MTGCTAGCGVVIDCDVAVGVPAIPSGGGPLAFVLVRLFGEPVGLLTEAVPNRGLQADELAAAIVRDFGVQLRERLAECGLELTEEMPTDGLCPPRVPGFLESRERVVSDGPAMTVAVCTRDRSDGLSALLDSLEAQEYKRLRVLVIDNAPSDDRTRRLVASLAGEREIEYVMEPRPGLSWARNRAIEASDDEILAWADDDAVCDPWWAAELARGFVEIPEAGAVTGIVIPSGIETPSQAWFEQYAGVSRGRGFTRAVFSPATAHTQSPLYPLPPFGSGNNMAFRREALDQIGGFDCALGAGTATHAGEDSAAFSTLLWLGGTIVYQPTAIMRHGHRREFAALRRQMQGYGRGLSAYYMSMLVHHPDCGRELLRLSRQAARDLLSPRGRRSEELGERFPRQLVWANRIGVLQGPFAYAAARAKARRLGRAKL